MLAWSPCLATGQVVRADTQAWAKGMPEGSHRINARWLTNRYRWMVSQRSSLPGWTYLKAARTIAGMEEQEFCAREAARIRLQSLEDDFPANAGPDLGDWLLGEEAVWCPVLAEPSFEVITAYLERQSMEAAICLQISP